MNSVENQGFSECSASFLNLGEFCELEEGQENQHILRAIDLARKPFHVMVTYLALTASSEALQLGVVRNPQGNNPDCRHEVGTDLCIEELDAHPCVHKANRVLNPERPKISIIHLLDAHYISVTDLAELMGLGVNATDEQLKVVAELHLDYMDLVEIIQRENKLVLETIVKDLGITEICIEAAQEDMRRINGALGKLRASEDYKGRREDELLIGAAGQMLLEGKIDRLVPVDDAETRDRAQSLMRVGRTEEANAMQNKRETMVLRNMVKNGGGNQLLVFGGLHGFPDNIKCTFPACEYTTVKTNAYHEHGPK